jgi:polar amino acid transport system permease protein
VPRGHIEAAASLGMTWGDEARFIVIPQAIRAITPALMSYAIIIFQATSLGFAIALPELLNAGYRIGSVTFNFLGVFALVGVLYAVVSISASKAVDRVHRRLHQA